MGQVERNAAAQLQQQLDQQASLPSHILGNYRLSPQDWLSNRRQQHLRNYLTPRVSVLVLSIVLCSVLDAFWTLLHIERGFHEANPFMARMLVYGPTSFVVLKMALTGAGVLILAVHQRSSLAWQGLHAMGFVYALLLGYHLVLFGMTP